MSSGFYGTAATAVNRGRGIPLGTSRPKAKRGIKSRKQEQKMKLSLRQRLRNWIMRDDDEYSDHAISVDETPHIESEGLRLQVYRASGGYVVETRSYDRKNDRNHNTMHVITDEEDLGERIGKIIMMEALRG
jgi:hypothetical protein